MDEQANTSVSDRVSCCEMECCTRDPAFWVYFPLQSSWIPLCRRHLRTRHPSLEIKVWLEGGFARPVELGRPQSRPKAPESGRQLAFREMLETTLQSPNRDQTD